MNCRLEKCGSLAVLVSLRTILPVAASAMKRSIDNTLRAERNAIHRPSGLIAGPTLRSSPRPSPPITLRPISFGGIACREHRPIGAADRGLPVVGQLTGLEPEHLFDRHVGVAGRRRRRQHLRDDVVAEAAADIRPERLAPAVGEVLAVVELLDRRQAVDPAFPGFPVGLVERPRGVAQPHRRVRIDRPEREVFGHPLDEPERKPLRAVLPGRRVRGSTSCRTETRGRARGR